MPRHQYLQKGKFSTRQTERRTVNTRRARCEIQGNLFTNQFVSCATNTSPEQTAGARLEFTKIKRYRQVVVRTHIQGAYFLID